MIEHIHLFLEKSSRLLYSPKKIILPTLYVDNFELFVLYIVD